MKKFILLLLICLPITLNAQRIKVVASCGGLTLPVSANADLYIDTTGRLCGISTSTVSGSVSITGVVEIDGDLSMTPIMIYGAGFTTFQCTSIGTAGCQVTTALTNIGNIICQNNSTTADYYIQMFKSAGAITLGTTVPDNSIFVPRGNLAGGTNLNWNYTGGLRLYGTTTRNGNTAAGSGALDCNGGTR